MARLVRLVQTPVGPVPALVGRTQTLVPLVQIGTEARAGSLPFEVQTETRVLPVEAQFKLLWFKFDGELGRDFNSGDMPDEWQWGLATRHKVSSAFKLLGPLTLAMAIASVFIPEALSLDEPILGWVQSRYPPSLIDKPLCSPEGRGGVLL